MKLKLSFICSKELMPESTSITLGSDAAKRIAQLGTDMDGSRAANNFSASSGTFASVPPLTGSMTMTGFPCFTQTSLQARLLTHSLSQSR